MSKTIGNYIEKNIKRDNTKDKLIPEMIKKTIKLLKKYKVKKPYYLKVEDYREYTDFLDSQCIPRCLKLQGYMRVKPTI